MWPTNSKQHLYMKERKLQNIERSKENANENWFEEKLKHLEIKHSRQATWGYRIFDFWIHSLGIAIEIDGKEHNPIRDKIRDEKNYKTSGIVVLRVKNRNEEDAKIALEAIKESETWNERRESLGLKLIKT